MRWRQRRGKWEEKKLERDRKKEKASTRDTEIKRARERLIHSNEE